MRTDKKQLLSLNESIKFCLNKTRLLNEIAAPAPDVGRQGEEWVSGPLTPRTPEIVYINKPPSSGQGENPRPTWNDLISRTGQGAVSVFADAYREFLQRWLTQGNEIPDPNTDPEGFRAFQQQFFEYLQNSGAFEKLSNLLQDSARGTQTTIGQIWNSIIDWANSEETQDMLFNMQFQPIPQGSPVIGVMARVDIAMLMLFLIGAYRDSDLESPGRLWSDIDSWISEYPFIGHQFWLDIFRPDRNTGPRRFGRSHTYHY